MKYPRHILHLEDDPDETALIQSIREAADSVCDIKRGEARNDFRATSEAGARPRMAGEMAHIRAATKAPSTFGDHGRGTRPKCPMRHHWFPILRGARKVRFPPINGPGRSGESRARVWCDRITQEITRLGSGMLLERGHPGKTMILQVNCPTSAAAVGKDVPKNKSVTIDKLTKIEKKRSLVGPAQGRGTRRLTIHLERSGEYVAGRENAPHLPADPDVSIASRRTGQE